ncbi:MAG: glycosyltransferase family 4 protein, partial [Planctomycetales bacterium]|nr:glycosyltransferase family 4 protein [Planctomycetales bacterium]
INDSYAFTIENWLRTKHFKFPKNLLRRLELKAAMRFEATTYEEFDIVHTMTHHDAMYLHGLNPRIRTCVIPNGVDQTAFRVCPCDPAIRNVVFVGGLGPENLPALLRILQTWNGVVDRYPESRFHVVGKTNQKARDAIRAAGGSTVIVHGYIESLNDAYKLAPIVIVPNDKTSGLVNKAIEAMAAGRVVVGFDSTLASIRDIQIGRHCVGVSSIEEFSSAICSLFENPTYVAKVQISGRQFAEASFHWEQRAVEYEAMYSVAADIALRKKANSKP